MRIPIKVKRGIATRVCSSMLPENWNVIRKKTRSPKPRYPKNTPRNIRVNEIGKPINMANSIVKIRRIPNTSGLMAISYFLKHRRI